MRGALARVGSALRRHPAAASLAALVAIALAAIWLQVGLARGRGVCFTEATWSFHFGSRVLDGAVPYEDFVYPRGPLPLYIDAALQRLLGAGYASSLDAAVLVCIARAVLVWLIARRLAGRLAASALAACCVASPVFGGGAHDADGYAELFLLAAGLCLVRASAAPPRAAIGWSCAAGAAVASIAWARPGAAWLAAGVLLAASAIAAARAELPWRRVAAVAAGVAAGAAVLLAGLAALGVLGSALDQALLGAGARRGVHGLALVPEALVGGTLTDPGLPTSFLATFLLWPCVLIGTSLYFASRPPEARVSVGALALLLVPAAALLSLASRYQLIGYFEDLPRTFLTAVVALALAAPRRLRAWLGLEPALAVALGALPLAVDWAAGIEVRGRPGGDLPALALGVALLACASSRLGLAARRWLCAALAVAAVAHGFADRRLAQVPHGRPRDADGPRAANRTRASHPLLRGARLTQQRAAVLDWLRARVPAGATCFIYGDAPLLYTLLACRNPTRIDSLARSYATAEDAGAAAEVLRAHPPDFVIAEAHLPPLDRPPAGPPAADDGSPASIIQRALLDRYEPIGSTDELALPPPAAPSCDGFTSLRLYRRR